MEKNFEITLTDHGPVRGVHKTSCLGKDYLSFQGIPYMKAPLGCLRFRDPQTPKPWTEPFNATEDAPSYCALNMMTRVMEGQENAGIINVYTKNINPEKFQPVMVYVSDVIFSSKKKLILFLALDSRWSFFKGKFSHRTLWT